MKLACLLPTPLKLQIKLAIRKTQDIFSKYDFAKQIGSVSSTMAPSGVYLEQEIKQSHLFENKIQNLKTGSAEIEKIYLEPGQVFSYWRALGRPSLKKGYKKGRNLIQGKLSEDIGGGLCQLSGIIYHTSLIAGLEVLERHCHTMDIYQDHERYTPLGADATVVYGYKDLRIRNPFDFPIHFKFHIDDKSIRCKLFAQKTIQPQQLTFSTVLSEQFKIVETIVSPSNLIIAKSRYLIPQ